MNGLGILALILFALIIYFFPTICAGKHKQKTAIFVLNALLGWTGIGWIIALVWSQTK